MGPAYRGLAKTRKKQSWCTLLDMQHECACTIKCKYVERKIELKKKQLLGIREEETIMVWPDYICG